MGRTRVGGSIGGAGNPSAANGTDASKVRSDRIRQATCITKRQTAAADAAFESMYALDNPTYWSDYTKGDTEVQGAAANFGV